jgi:isoleucyl-tRNA synthetase
MKSIAQLVSGWQQDAITQVESAAGWSGTVDGDLVELTLEDFEITAQDIPGWEVAIEGSMTVALDITITEPLRQEGIARELVNRIQTIRKETGMEVTDRIQVKILTHHAINEAVQANLDYICAETLAGSLELLDNVSEGHEVEVEDGVTTRIAIHKLQ